MRLRPEQSLDLRGQKLYAFVLCKQGVRGSSPRASTIRKAPDRELLPGSWTEKFSSDSRGVFFAFE
jgi:hypothetical protein